MLQELRKRATEKNVECNWQVIGAIHGALMRLDVIGGGFGVFRDILGWKEKNLKKLQFCLILLSFSLFL